MRRGLRKGDHVGIIGFPGIRYHVLHIALQYLGAVNVTLPPTFSRDEIEELAQSYRFKLLYIEHAAQFMGYGELKEMKGQLLAVVIGEDEVDALDPEKVVTFDRVVTLGKSAWREEASELKTMKAAVLPQDLYSIMVEDKGKCFPMRMEQWMEAVDQAEKLLQHVQTRSLLAVLPPDRLLWRAYGFAAIFNRISWWIRPHHDLRNAAYTEIKPQVILLDPTGLRNLYDLLPEMIDLAEKGRKTIRAALEVIRKREDARAIGKKDAFLNRVKYRTSNRKLYSRIKAKLGSRICEVVCDHGMIDADARVLLEESGIKVTQF